MIEGLINAWEIYAQAHTSPMPLQEMLDDVYPAEAAGFILILNNQDIRSAMEYVAAALDMARKRENLSRIILWQKVLDLLRSAS